MAASVMPVRHGRPMESLTMTATSTPSLARSPSRSRAAEASGSTGSSASSLRATFEMSTPAAASTSPSRFWTIRRSPRVATTRTDSSSTASRRACSRRSASAVGNVISLPSIFDTTLEVTTSTSPSCNWGAASATAATRSSPGRRSGIPVTGRISRRVAPWSAGGKSDTSQLQGSVDHVGGRGVIRHQERDGADRQPGTSAVSVLCTSQPSRTPPDPRAP